MTIGELQKRLEALAADGDLSIDASVCVDDVQRFVALEYVGVFEGVVILDTRPRGEA